MITGKQMAAKWQPAEALTAQHKGLKQGSRVRVESRPVESESSRDWSGVEWCGWCRARCLLSVVGAKSQSSQSTVAMVKPLRLTKHIYNSPSSFAEPKETNERHVSYLYSLSPLLGASDVMAINKSVLITRLMTSGMPADSRNASTNNWSQQQQQQEKEKEEEEGLDQDWLVVRVMYVRHGSLWLLSSSQDARWSVTK